MNTEEIVYETLETLHIDFEKHEHPPVYTVDEAYKYWKDIEGLHTKNIFLRNKKGNRHFLVILESKKTLNIKKFQEKIGAGTLSFASERRLEEHLGLSTGAVSVFGLINDTKKEVEVIVDRHLLQGKMINFHPNVNTATIGISTEDFKKFLDWCSNKVSYVDL